MTVRVVDGAHGVLDRGEGMLRELDNLAGVAGFQELLDRSITSSMPCA